MVGAPPTATPPPTTKAAMAARIKQLEQRLATMASFQHRSHLGGEAPTSYGGDDLFYMASVAHIEVFVAVMRGVTRASEPRGAIMELDPQRGEIGR
jgi:beta-lactamase class A